MLSRARSVALAGGALVLGTLLRLGLGLRHHPWATSSDAYAWGLLFDAPGLRLDQLVHLPHEGGTLLVGLLALPFGGRGLAETWAILPPLGLGQLLADTAARAVQIAVAWRLLGPRTGAWFAAWTVAAVPGLLPWGTVPPCLHATASFWPFLLAAAALGGRPVLAGLLLGPALAFSYDNLVLLPILAGALALAFARGRLPPRPAAAVAAAGLASLVAQQALAAWAPLGAALVPDRPGTLRGVDLVRDLGLLGARLPTVLTQVLPGAVVASPFQDLLGPGVGAAWLLLALAGLGLAAGRARGLPPWTLALVAGFVGLYAASPFPPDGLSYTGFYAYRHLVFVLPALAALALHGLARWTPAALLFVGLGLVPLLAPLPAAPVPDPPAEAAGWHLGQKLGDQPDRVLALVAPRPEAEAAALRRGLGWGITAAVMGADPAGAPRVRALVEAFPLAARPDLAAGARRAYDPASTPRLPGRLEDLALQPWTVVATEGPLVQVEPDRIALYGNGRLTLDLPGEGELLLLLSGDPAEGRGPRVQVEDGAGPATTLGPVGPRPEVHRVPRAGPRITLRYEDDVVDGAGADRNLYLGWAARAGPED